MKLRGKQAAGWRACPSFSESLAFVDSWAGADWSKTRDRAGLAGPATSRSDSLSRTFARALRISGECSGPCWQQSWSLVDCSNGVHGVTSRDTSAAGLNLTSASFASCSLFPLPPDATEGVGTPVLRSGLLCPGCRGGGSPVGSGGFSLGTTLPTERAASSTISRAQKKRPLTLTT